MKKITLAAAIGTAALMMTACGGGDTATTTAAATEAATTAATTEAATTAAAADDAAETEAAADASGDASATAEEGKITGPFIITSCGQTPGAVMLNMMAQQNGIESVADNAVTADTFDPGNAKTLIVTAGTSGKGMGAAGTDVNAEIARCEGVIAKAKEAGLTVVGAHIEGMARRTDQADQDSIDCVMSNADVMLVIDESDSDGWFTNYAAENGKPIIKVKDALSIAEVMQ